MRRVPLVIFGLALLLMVSGPAAAHDPGSERFQANLSGDNEVPPVDSESSGRARVQFTSDASEAEFELRVRDGERLTQAHIHCAGPEDNGPVVAFLAGFHDAGWDVDGSWVQDATLTDANVIASDPGMNPTCPLVIQSMADIAEAIRQGYAYVNVHSVANPGGEVRGQLGD